MEKNIISLLLVRYIFTAMSTLGKLYINGKFFCYSLEDAVRKKGIKIPNETAISEGCYNVNITYSKKFKRKVPVLLNVPFFNGIRIHGGNTPKDTTGCILIAYNKLNDNIIYGSAEKELTNFLKKQTDEILITITNKIL